MPCVVADNYNIQEILYHLVENYCIAGLRLGYINSILSIELYRYIDNIYKPDNKELLLKDRDIYILNLIDRTYESISDVYIRDTLVKILLYIKDNDLIGERLYENGDDFDPWEDEEPNGVIYRDCSNIQERIYRLNVHDINIAKRSNMYHICVQKVHNGLVIKNIAGSTTDPIYSILLDMLRYTGIIYSSIYINDMQSKIWKMLFKYGIDNNISCGHVVDYLGNKIIHKCSSIEDINMLYNKYGMGGSDNLLSRWYIGTI